MAAAPATTRSDPATALLREQARAALRRRTCATADRLATDVAPAWERRPAPSDREVEAALTDAPGVHALPDGRLVHLGAALEDRVLTTTADSALVAAGLLEIDPDLTAVLQPFRHWTRIPVRHGRVLGLAERAVTRHGTAVLAMDPRLVPADAELVAVHPGVEGLRLCAAHPDPAATTELARVVHPLSGASTGGPASWSLTDRLLLALVTDDRLCREPAAPISQLREPWCGTDAAASRSAA